MRKGVKSIWLTLKVLLYQINKNTTDQLPIQKDLKENIDQKFQRKSEIFT